MFFVCVFVALFFFFFFFNDTATTEIYTLSLHDALPIAAGTHSYTAMYGGNSTYAASTSAAVTVTASSNGSYLSTTFNEYSAGHVLNGTAPAVDVAGGTWSDLNGDWKYASGGGIVSANTDLAYPALINISQANYAAAFTYPAAGAQLLFRYVDANDYVSVQTYSFGEVALLSTVGGTRTVLASIWPSNPAAPLTVTLNGSTGTITCGGQTASGTIPSTLLSGTQLGFFAASTGFSISSLNVTPTTQATATTTTLMASNTSPPTGSSVTLTATTSPSAATGTVTFLDGSTTVGTGTLSSGIATYTVSAITAGTHSYTAVYGGNSTYAASTSAAVTVTASSTQTATTTTLTASNTAPAAGSSVTLTATTSPSAATGTVTFLDG